MFLLPRLVFRSNHVSNQRIFGQAKCFMSSDDKEGKSDVPIKRKPVDSDLKKIKIPDETPGLPKKLVFQELTKPTNSEPIFTLAEAAAYVPKETPNIYYRYPTLQQQHTDIHYAHRGIDNEDTFVFQFPEVTDFLCIGGGLIGSATAYYAKKMISRVGDVLVIDKEPYTPHNMTALCNGLISCQSKCQETIRLAGLSKELLRNLANDLVVSRDDLVQLKYRPVTHLILWRENDVNDVMNAIDMQMQDGYFSEAKIPRELEETFPWLKVCGTDVALGSHGNQDEALVDPMGLRNLYRTLAQAYGANFIKAEAIDFNTQYSMHSYELNPSSTRAIVARITSTGQLRHLGFNRCLLSLGHNTPYLEARSEMDAHVRDSIDDMHFIQPRLRVHFSFHSLNAPVINFPVITDTDGSMLIKDDFCGDFKYFLTYEDSDFFMEKDQTIFMDMDSDDPYRNYIHKSEMFKNYFEDVIKPKLVRRIPIMNDATFNLAYSGFESYNTHDGSPVIGIHPFHAEVLISGGYGSRLMTYAPAAGLALSELMLYDEERTLDITKFYWSRVLNGRKLDEFDTIIK